MKSIIVFGCVFLGLVGCASAHKDLSGIQVGMQKADILDVYGNPQRVDRVKGQDQWIYITYSDREVTEKKVIFAEGKVVGVIDSEKERQLENELEKTAPKTP
jgi:outer membrane protein assembly factor BamE (lipoprotein component of BamABCDE complex)